MCNPMLMFFLVLGQEAAGAASSGWQNLLPHFNRQFSPWSLQVTKHFVLSKQAQGSTACVPLLCRKLFWDAASEHEILCLDGIWSRFSWHLVITVYSGSNPGIVVFSFAALCFIPPQCHLTWEGTQAFLFADVLVRDWSGWKETLGFASTISAVILLTSLACLTAGARRVGSFWWGARTACATHHLLLACTSPSQGWRFGSLTFLDTAAVRTIRQGAQRIWPGSSSISVLTFLFSSTFLVPPVVYSHTHTHICVLFLLSLARKKKKQTTK